MADYLLVRDSDNEIVSWGNTTMACDLHRLVDVDAQAITGSTVPMSPDRGKMTGGTLTPGFVYTAPVLTDWDSRYASWTDACADWYADGVFSISLSDSLQRKIQAGDRNAVTESEWVELETSYPQ